ncbi:MAG TPA: hypothetical protein PLT42_08710, partial [Sphaerochaeta sp.]|nr:hypothetical protein [Sphaerochaeta sp.]
VLPHQLDRPGRGHRLDDLPGITAAGNGSEKMRCRELPIAPPCGGAWTKTFDTQEEDPMKIVFPTEKGTTR